MSAEGFESLADGALLVLVLLVGSSLVLGAHPPSLEPPREDGARYTEETMLAIFRTTLEGLWYGSGGERIPIPNGTSVALLLQLQVHLRARNGSAFDFSAANADVERIGNAIVRPGWGWALTGGTFPGGEEVRVPAGVQEPETRFESAWIYPALQSGPGEIRLALALWISPLR